MELYRLIHLINLTGASTGASTGGNMPPAKQVHHRNHIGNTRLGSTRFKNTVIFTTEFQNA